MIGRAFCRHAAERVARHLRGLSKNRDADTLAAADAVLGWEGKVRQ